MTRTKQILLSLGLAAAAAGCATESHRTLAARAPAAAARPYAGPLQPVVVGDLPNQSEYLRGVFSDGSDRLGDQARSILKTHLSNARRFNLMERDQAEALAREANLAGAESRPTGARFVITGAVTEVGRREIGDRELYGILGRGKSQIAYGKVSLQVVDVISSSVVYTAQGAGEYELSNREILGFGGTAEYDSTLMGKVLDLAVAEAVDGLVRALERGEWGQG